MALYSLKFVLLKTQIVKVRKATKIRNRYNQVLHLTQITSFSHRFRTFPVTYVLGNSIYFNLQELNMYMRNDTWKCDLRCSKFLYLTIQMVCNNRVVQIVHQLLSCQPRVTVTSCLGCKVISDYNRYITCVLILSAG